MERLTDEALNHLERVAHDSVPAVRGAFRDYARTIHANEWAEYNDGETEEYLRCFAPMIRALVSHCSNVISEPPEESWRRMEHLVFNLLKGVSSKQATTDPTWPWRSSVLFENAEFQAAVRATIKDQLLLQIAKSMDHTESEERASELTEQSAGTGLGAKCAPIQVRGIWADNALPEQSNSGATLAPGLTTLKRTNAMGSPEDRLTLFMREHPTTTYADIKYSASVHAADFQHWRKGKLKDSSVMFKRIESVLSGTTPLKKKPRKLPAD